MLGISGMVQWAKRAPVSTECRRHVGCSASFGSFGDVSLEADRKKDRLQAL